ncbi:hypothetical protein K435DRAFT_861052 [Dendrothele bispora CBS 962.96]|uniref:Uncharacterized protein n=1 Tax=Dendrothele bispora (strain CBS 962.96) TaxID=1314807 RepID=A0A4S8LWE5_DENBC|nr:hypothetical protein K435DRAFT_861052 [Dendrothele bispora CBS 962.96]
MECPLCRKFFSFNSLQRLYVEQPEDPDRMKKYNLMRKLVLTCDSKEEDIVTMRKEVDVWQGSKTVREEKHCPVRKTVEILDRLQRVKDQKRRHKREIKHLKRSAMRKEQELLELIIQYQQEAGRLRAELKLRQKTDDLHVSAAKKKLTRPLPIPPRVTATCPTVQIIRPSPDQHVSVANTGSDLRRRTSLNKGKRNGRMNVNPSSLEVPPSAPPPSPPQVRSTTAVRHYVPSDNSVVIDVDHSRDTGARSPYDTPGARAPHVAGRGIGLNEESFVDKAAIYREAARHYGPIDDD